MKNEEIRTVRRAERLLGFLLGVAVMCAFNAVFHAFVVLR